MFAACDGKVMMKVFRGTRADILIPLMGC